MSSSFPSSRNPITYYSWIIIFRNTRHKFQHQFFITSPSHSSLQHKLTAYKMVCQLLIIADSRARYLQREIGSTQVKVLHFAGATLERIIRSSANACAAIKPRYILIMGGICDITVRNRASKEISITKSSDTELFNYMYHTILAANDLAHRLLPNTKIIFGGLCGMDLNRYNHRNGYHAQQGILDDVVHQVNLLIHELNLHNGVPHPNLTNKVHKVANGNNGHYRNHYRMLIDGIHAGPILLADWALNIRKMFNRLTGFEATSRWR